MSVELLELDDAAHGRLSVTTLLRGFWGSPQLSLSGKFKAGEFDNVEPDGLMAVLAFFPELD